MPRLGSKEALEAERFLFGLQGFGVKLGLRNITAFLHKLGDPQNALPAIHIAGTNGKGSTAAFLASILMEAGYRTALYTSPHLVVYRERMRVQGRMIPAAYVSSWVKKHRRTIVDRKITFFEATTALAFDWFRNRSVDVAVIETGLGGRLDATNVLDPILTILTSISRDHTHILGRNILSIAREKAGIAKAGVPCILGSQEFLSTRRIRNMLDRKHVPVVSDDSLRVEEIDRSGSPRSIRIRSNKHRVERVVSGFGGRHQKQNIGTVLHALHVLEDSYGFRLRDSHIRDGIRNVQRNSGLQARCMPVAGQRGVYVDVAHNPEAMRTSAAYFESIGGKGSYRVVFGISADKDVRSVLLYLKPIVKELTVVQARTSRSLDVRRILRMCRDISIPAREGGPVTRGLRMALQDRGRDPVLVTGSHFVVGEALASLRRRKYLTISQ